MNDNIQRVIIEFRKSQIQSEAEVISKLIIPIFNILGYPSYSRAQEFPVYGFEGRKKVPVKNADLIYFTNNEFGKHRKCKQEDIDWVYQNSLLVVEAKKPGEMPELLGQPVYYTQWTRAVAYIAIDGNQIEGYFYNGISADYKLINCSINDLPECDELMKFSYENLSNIKRRGKYTKNFLSFSDEKFDILQEYADENGLRLIDAESVQKVTEEDIEDLPDSTIQYMRHALGRNADGLDNLQLLSRFLNTTDAILQNDLRYDIGKYAFDLPRRIIPARLHINNVVLPIDKGNITEFYWNEYERYHYESKYIIIDIEYESGSLYGFEVGFHVLDPSVSERLSGFDQVKQILKADKIEIISDCNKHPKIELPSSNPGKMWGSKEYDSFICDFWLTGLEQMKEIENFYDITFKLEYIEGEDNLNALYDAISFVYDGVVLNENCTIELPGGLVDEDIIIEEPILLENHKEIPLQERVIHNVYFIPYQSWILPGTIPMKGTTKKDIVNVSGCCRYKIAP